MDGGGDVETWKAVEGYEGLYEVSDLGRVRSLDRTVLRKGKPLRLRGDIKSLAMDSSGYLQARMTKDGKGRLHLVHRLVAIAFIENPSALPEVNHTDLDKTNNAKSNLEWSDHPDNMKHAGDRGRLCGYLNRNKRTKLSPIQVRKIRKALACGGTNRSVAKQFGVSKTLIGNIRINERWNPEILESAPKLLLAPHANA